MKTLVIEDLTIKASDIAEYLNECGIKDITLRKSRNTGLIELRKAANEEHSYELLILDMQFPIYEDGPIDREAGIDILREIKRLKYDALAVIMCSSDDVSRKVQGFSNVSGIIQYDYSVDLTPQFKEVVSKIREMKKDVSYEISEREEDCL